MEYLDYDKLSAFDSAGFRNRSPYPWANPQGLLTTEGFQHLVSHLPDIALFEGSFGYERRHGQKSHDKYVLEYKPDLAIDPAWHEFIGELEGPVYKKFLRSVYGAKPFRLSYFWHFAKRGGDVSPHVDARSKIGSHIFYLNTPEDWREEWGGQTLILDDHGKFKYKSAPAFSDFEEPAAAKTLGNYSMIFKRTRHSWHGVKAIECPEEHLRKVFIVVVKTVRPIKAIRSFLSRGRSERAA